MANETLNRHFERAIPRMIEKAAESIDVIAPALREMDDLVAETLDHLRFEIEKARLARDRQEWESRSDTASLDRRIEQLSKMLEVMTPERLATSKTFLSDFIESLKALQSEQAA